MPIENWFLTKANQLNEAPNKLFKDLEKVTIVIPSYQRQNYLLRQIIYWRNSGVSLLILDGSDNSLPAIILDKISNWSDIKYIHMPVSIEERLNSAIEYIDTEYVASLADDGFFLKSSLSKLVIELDIDKGLSGCIGQCLGINVSENKDKFLYGASYNYWQHSATQDDLNQRLVYSVKQANSATAYGLLRKNAWIAGWGDVPSSSCAFVPEVYQAIATQVFGKYKAFDELFWLESSENPAVSNAGWRRKYYFHHWWGDKSKFKEKELFIEKLTKLIVSQHGCSVEQAHETIFMVADEICLYLKGYLYRPFNVRFKSIVAKILRSVMPLNLYNFLKELAGFNRVIVAPLPLFENVKYPWLGFVQSNNVDIVNDEIIEIEELVVDFHKHITSEQC